MKKKTKTRIPTAKTNVDGVYLLKIVLYLILGSTWLKISNGAGLHVPVPLGFICGFIFAMHEHFRIDRKIEYAILVIAMFIGFVSPYGLYVNF